MRVACRRLVASRIEMYTREDSDADAVVDDEVDDAVDNAHAVNSEQGPHFHDDSQDGTAHELSRL